MGKLVRCGAGHVYDSSAHAACPECARVGADEAPAGDAGAPDHAIAPRAAPLIPTRIPLPWLAGGGLAVLLAVVAGTYLLRAPAPPSDTTGEVPEQQASSKIQPQPGPASPGSAGGAPAGSPASPKPSASTAASADPTGDPEYQACKKTAGDASIAACDRAIAAGKWDGANLSALYRYRGFARVHGDKHETDAALDDYGEAIRLDPANFIAYALRSELYGEAGKDDRALKDLNRVIELKPRADYFNNRGTYFRKLGQLDRAIGDFDRSIALDPKYYLPYWNRGLAYQDKGDTDRATADYRQALSLNPPADLKTKIVARLAIVGSSAGSAGAGRPDSSSGPQPNPDTKPESSTNPAPQGVVPKSATGSANATSLLKQGLAYLAKNDYDGAITDLNQAIRLNANNATAFAARGEAYRGKGDTERAIQDFTQAIQLDPGQSYAYEKRGGAYLQKGLYETAIRDFDDAIRLNPQNAAAYKYRATAYLELKNYQRAVQDFSAAIAIDPNYAEAYADRALAYQNLFDEEDAALDDFNTAVRLDPTDALTYKNRAFLHWKRREVDQASIDFMVALSLRPGDNSLRQQIHAARAQLGNPRINPDPVHKLSRRARSSQDFQACEKSSGEQALAACTRAIDSGKLSGTDLAALYTNRGVHRRNGGDFDGALSDYDEALKLDANFATALNNRSDVDGKKGDYDKAIEDAERAIRIYPNYRNALINRGIALAKMGKLNDAIVNFNQAIGIDPTSPRAFMNRGQAWLDMGQRERAKFDFGVALSRSTDDEQKRKLQEMLDSLGGLPGVSALDASSDSPGTEGTPSAGSTDASRRSSSPRVIFNPADIQ